MGNCARIIDAFDAVINKLRTAALKKEKLDVTANGTYRAPQNTGYVTVNVDVPAPTGRTEEAITITQNGVTDVPADKVYTPITVNVPTGSSRTEEAKTITENGVTNVPADKVYTPITVAVPIPTFSTQEKTLNVTANGTQTVTPDSGKDGLSKVTVTTNVPQRTAEAKTITENGVTNVPDGKVYTPITVDVPQRTAEALTITQNGVTNTPDGKYYDPITVNVSNTPSMFSGSIENANGNTVTVSQSSAVQSLIASGARTPMLFQINEQTRKGILTGSIRLFRYNSLQDFTGALSVTLDCTVYDTNPDTTTPTYSKTRQNLSKNTGEKTLITGITNSGTSNNVLIVSSFEFPVSNLVAPKDMINGYWIKVTKIGASAFPNENATLIGGSSVGATLVYPT